MNTNGTNPGMNVEDYEDKAIQKSNAAKRIAVGGAAFLGGAAVAGGAAYAAGQPEGQTADETLTTEDIIGGAEAGSEYKEAETQETQETHTATHTTTEHVVIVEKPAAEVYHEEAQAAEEPNVTWDETTNFYVGDTKIGSIEEGTINGHKFAIADGDGDGVADLLAVDSNGNDRFDQDEFMQLSESDNIHMGHETAQVTNERFTPQEINGYDEQHQANENYIAQNQEPIYNNFEDEKTGEAYYGDFAENNPDYNPNGLVDGYNSNQYLAENDRYSAEMEGLPNPESRIDDGFNEDIAENDIYAADEQPEEYIAENDTYTDDSTYTPEVDDPAMAQAETYGEPDNIEYDSDLAENNADAEADENSESLDSMMENEEFLG